MNLKHRVTLLPDGVEVSDLQPVSKRSRGCYDSVSPCHIPNIRVNMSIQDETEKISIKIPTQILQDIPMLKDFKEVVEGGAPAAGEGAIATSNLSAHDASESRDHAHDDAGNDSIRTGLSDSDDGNSAVLQLPGGSWGLLVMLKVLLDRHLDMDKVLLVDALVPAGAAALAVRSRHP